MGARQERRASGRHAVVERLGAAAGQHPLELPGSPSTRRHSATASSRRSASGPYDGGDGESATAPEQRAGDAVVPEAHEQRDEVAHRGHEVRRVAAGAEVVEEGDEPLGRLVEGAAARPQRRGRQRRHLDEEPVARRAGRGLGAVEVGDRPRRVEVQDDLAR